MSPNDEYSTTSILKDTELFKDEDDIIQKVISVKRVMQDKEDCWHIYEDKNLTLNIRGSRFSMKQRKFLETPEGFNFIISGYKKGLNSVSKFKQALRET